MRGDKLLQLNRLLQAESYHDKLESFVLDLRENPLNNIGSNEFKIHRNPISVKSILIRVLIAATFVIAASSTGYLVNAQSNKISATVNGWYETKRIDNERLEINTNMGVWVNGKKFNDCTNLESTSQKSVWF